MPRQVVEGWAAARTSVDAPFASNVAWYASSLHPSRSAADILHPAVNYPIAPILIAIAITEKSKAQFSLAERYYSAGSRGKRRRRFQVGLHRPPPQLLVTSSCPDPTQHRHAPCSTTCLRPFSFLLIRATASWLRIRATQNGRSNRPIVTDCSSSPLRAGARCWGVGIRHRHHRRLRPTSFIPVIYLRRDLLFASAPHLDSPHTTRLPSES